MLKEVNRNLFNRNRLIKLYSCYVCRVACQMESQCAAHQLSLTKHRNQEASLQDSLAKTAALSQGLAMDKVELNRLLLQVSEQ